MMQVSTVMTIPVVVLSSPLTAAGASSVVYASTGVAASWPLGRKVRAVVVLVNRNPPSRSWPKSSSDFVASPWGEGWRDFVEQVVYALSCRGCGAPCA